MPHDTGLRGAPCMVSIIIATRDSESALMQTLGALAPGATAGLAREVIVADGGAKDATEQIADIAGCRFFASSGSNGSRLRAAAATARGEWLMFLAPGVVLGPGWVDECASFVQQPAVPSRAAVYAARTGMDSRLRRALNLLPRPEQSLIIGRSFYDELGGHHAHATDTEADLLPRIGRSRLVRLRTTAGKTNI